MLTRNSISSCSQPRRAMGIAPLRSGHIDHTEMDVEVVLLSDRPSTRATLVDEFSPTLFPPWAFRVPNIRRAELQILLMILRDVAAAWAPATDPGHRRRS